MVLNTSCWKYINNFLLLSFSLKYLLSTQCTINNDNNNNILIIAVKKPSIYIYTLICCKISYYIVCLCLVDVVERKKKSCINQID